MNNINYAGDTHADFQITMELYETDRHTLQEFIKNQEKSREFSEKYLILYNFATDCTYSDHIQPEIGRAHV